MYGEAFGGVAVCGKLQERLITSAQTGENMNPESDQECAHDWKFISDWGGDPDVIGGTFDCSRWVCQMCGDEDLKRDPPRDGPELD